VTPARAETAWSAIRPGELPPNEEKIIKSCYYPASSIRKLKGLGERLGRYDVR
jgi:hypothetical protein